METIDNYIANTILNFCDFNTKLNLILTNKIFSLNKNSLLIDFLKEELQINFYDETIKDYYFQKIAIELNKYNIDSINYKYNNFFKSSSKEQTKVSRFLAMNLLNLIKNNNKHCLFWKILTLSYILELRRKKSSIIYYNIIFQNNILLLCNDNNIIICELKYKILTTIP